MKRIYPPMYFKISLAVTIAAHFLIPVLTIIHSPYNYFGIVLIIIGLMLNIWSDRIFKKENNPISPDQKPRVLINYGPFKISRNPMYFGMALALLGTAVLLGSAGSSIGLLFFIFWIEKFIIPIEERHLAEVFGNEYIAYKNKVRGWI